MSAARPQTSTRDVATLLPRLASWLGAQLGADELPLIGNPTAPGGAGLSSETVLFELEWSTGGEARGGRFVLRLPPPSDAFPLFPTYDLGRQVSAMRLIAERSAVPVPAIPWFESSGDVLGSPFFVMAQADGRVVADVPPYVFGSWVTEASSTEQRRIGDAAVDVLVGIHGVDLDTAGAATWELDAPGSTALARHVANQRRYYDWIRGTSTFPLIEDTFAWLDEHWPTNATDRVLSWGDARLANILWSGFQPVGVLDWEAVAVGPRELDLGWLIWFADYFQRIAVKYGHPGAPDLLRREDAVARYAERSGHTPVHLDWYLVYAELRQALTSIRVSSRAVHFGERAAPDDHQDLILDRSHLEEVLSR